jgi:hypothetical protein
MEERLERRPDGGERGPDEPGHDDAREAQAKEEGLGPRVLEERADVECLIADREADEDGARQRDARERERAAEPDGRSGRRVRAV